MGSGTVGLVTRRDMERHGYLQRGSRSCTLAGIISYHRFSLVFQAFWPILKPSRIQNLVNQPTIFRLEFATSCPKNPWVLFLGPEDDICRSIWGVHAVDPSPQGRESLITEKFLG
jgi:hypothetical protein